MKLIYVLDYTLYFSMFVHVCVGMGETIMNSYQGVVLSKIKEAFDQGDIESAKLLQVFSYTMLQYWI